MQKPNSERPSDEKLIAYLDGELEASERVAVEQALASDSELRERAARLTESAAALRGAFDEVLREALPERLIAAARGDGKIASLAAARAAKTEKTRVFPWIGERSWMAGVAASIVALMIGVGTGYFGHNTVSPPVGNLVENAAANYKLVNAGAAADVNADGDLKDVHAPNLKPWGLNYQGARYVVVEGHQATQMFYTPDKPGLEPLTVIVAPTSEADQRPLPDQSKDDVKVLHWRHGGHVYAIVGKWDWGPLWQIYGDIGWQLDAI